MTAVKTMKNICIVTKPYFYFDRPSLFLSTANVPSKRPLPFTHFNMKLQVFIHGIDVVEDVLYYPGDDAHWVCVMEIPLKWEATTI